MIQSENDTWESVSIVDSFFRDIKVIENLNEFMNLIEQDRTLKGVDIAKYILSKVKCTQTKLQKLVYLCFADYLCNREKEMFIDKIYACRYGPLIDTVYKKYKKYGYKDVEDDTEYIDSEGIYEMPSRSRILFAEDGVEKIASIEDTLKRYGDLSSNELVALTHRNYSPWSITVRNTLSKNNPTIKSDVINEYYRFEAL